MRTLRLAAVAVGFLAGFFACFGMWRLLTPEPVTGWPLHMLVVGGLSWLAMGWVVSGVAGSGFDLWRETREHNRRVREDVARQNRAAQFFGPNIARMEGRPADWSPPPSDRG